MSRPTDWRPALWQETLEELLNDETVFEYADQWTLNFNYNLSNEERRRGWKIFSPCVHGQFRCSACNKTWSSARITVLFHYRLLSNRARGTVIMRPYRQGCRSCTNDDFELPGFSQKNVEQVLHWLLAKIRKNCYGEPVDDVVVSRRPTWRTKPHERDLCEACIEGSCCEDDEN
ncbi:receptor-transporting protein 3-like [Aulostomus maculatus]